MKINVKRQKRGKNKPKPNSPKLTFLPLLPAVPVATGLAFTSAFFFPKSKNIAVAVAELLRRNPYGDEGGDDDDNDDDGHDDDNDDVAEVVRRMWEVGRGALKPKPEGVPVGSVGTKRLQLLVEVEARMRPRSCEINPL